MLALKLRSATMAGIMLAAVVSSADAQRSITTPREQLGFNLGDDYQLANYTQLQAYWSKLEQESDRMVLRRIGTTAEGQPMLMAIISSPENIRNVDRHRETSRRLALAEGLSEEQARALARDGKAVVWIDGGLHANEVLGAQQLMETVFQLVSRDDPETVRILNDVVLLAVLANPDGMQLVPNWYMRHQDSQQRTLSGVPRLYQKYIGHDNNRDFYMSAQPESEAMNRILYREWYPQIVYNHHQTSPAGTVMFAPPFRDPFNFVYDPLVIAGLDLVSAAMHTRFIAEGKRGVTMRSGANYSTWWNGGLRTTVYFHNMIGLLTETMGSPTPTDIPLVPQNQLPRGDLPAPIAPQRWHFRQSVDYSVTANYAVLDVASRYRETFLFNIWRMGRNAIERGSADTWTHYPRRVDSLRAAAAQRQQAQEAEGRVSLSTAPFGRGVPAELYSVLQRPEDRDPRAYVLSTDQPDFLTVTKFMNALIKTGVTVHRATAAFTAGGKRYPAGSYVVQTAQAFAPHVHDMFEPQDHPSDLMYPGGPPRPPYDNAGWTLAYQMGVRFDRHLDAVTGPFERIDDLIRPPVGTVANVASGGGWLLSHRTNDAFVAVNRVLRTGGEVHWTQAPFSVGNRRWEAGTFYIPAASANRDSLSGLATELGLRFEAAPARMTVGMERVRPMRIGLWDRYGGSMPSGWTRWILEQYEFPFEVVYPAALDTGDLRARFDVLLFVDGAIPHNDTIAGRMAAQLPAPDEIPEEFRPWLGQVTVARTVPQLRSFLERGGRVISIGGSTVLAQHLGLPVSSALVEGGADGRERPLSREQYYIPGSILRVRVDTTLPIAHGISSDLDVMFDNSPVFRLGNDAASRGVRPIAWFDTPRPLRSGWAWGQERLEGGVTMAEARVGQGSLFLFGPEIAFRAQPHGTFKLLFNALTLPAAQR